MSIFRRFYISFLDILFPRQCVGCRNLGVWICNECLSDINQRFEQECYRCYGKSPSGITCCRCKEQGSHILDGLVVAASYKGNKKLARMLYGLKYKSHDEELGEKLSTLIWNAMNRVFSEEVLGRVVVIPVPLYAKRLQERGFNQSEVLTQCFRGGISVRTDVLERHEKTKSQVEAGKRKERQENLKGAFRVVVQSFERGQSLDPNAFYLIVDDVCTTGSTLEECCSTLRSAGAKYVWGATVARA